MTGANFDNKARSTERASLDESNPLDTLANLSNLLNTFPEAQREAVVKQLFRQFASVFHPDQPTGNEEAFKEVQAARDRFFATPRMTQAFLKEFARQEPLHIRIDKQMKELELKNERSRAQLKQLVSRLEEDYLRQVGKSREDSPTVFNIAPCVLHLTDSKATEAGLDNPEAIPLDHDLEHDDSIIYETFEALQSTNEFRLVVQEDGTLIKIQNEEEEVLEGRVIVGTIPEKKFQIIKAKLESGSDNNYRRITGGSSEGASSVYKGSTIVMPGQFASMLLPNLTAKMEGGNAVVTLTKTDDGVIYYAVEGTLGKDLTYDDGSAIELL